MSHFALLLCYCAAERQAWQAVFPVVIYTSFTKLSTDLSCHCCAVCKTVHIKQNA